MGGLVQHGEPDSWDGLPVALYRTSPEGKILDANQELVALLGYPSREAVLQTRAEDFYPDPRDRDHWRTLAEAHGVLRGFETRLRRFDGSVFWAREATRVRYGEDGCVVFYEGVLEDISEQKRAEQALHASEEKFRQLTERSPNMIFINRGGRVVYANRACEEITGYGREELCSEGFDFLSLIAPDCLDLVRAAFARHAAGEEVAPYEYALVTKDGRRIEALNATKLIQFEGERAILGIVTDITARKRAEEAQARLSMAVEQAAESIVITDTAGTILYVNPAFEQVAGYSRDEVLGRNPRVLKSGRQDPAFYRELWATLTAGRVWSGRFVNRRKDGSYYEEDATISPVRDATGRVVNYVAVKRDVTNEVRLEAQLLQAQKMEAVGRLAGGVAHDFNNLLGVIGGYGEMVLRRLAETDPLRGKVEQILKAARRAGSLTRQLLAFSRKQILQPEILDLNLVVADLEKMLERLIGEDVELITVLHPLLGSVRADPGQVDQVIMNLAVNARDAMPHGGRLTIETRNVTLDQAHSERRPALRPGRYVMLAVSDTGEGMDADTQSHIFEPFFTTKEQGKGTGLGLSTVYGIVKQSEGYIWVYSELGAGTTLKVYLPRVDEETNSRTAPSPPPTPGFETILLVEDEETLREVFQEALQRNGHRVLPAGNGEEALRLAEGHVGPIHLLVTDVVMPGFDGREVADRVVARRPETKVLFVSGYTDDAVLRHGVPEGRAFLEKPFGPDTLLRRVREVLDGN